MSIGDWITDSWPRQREQLVTRASGYRVLATACAGVLGKELGAGEKKKGTTKLLELLDV